MIITVVQKPQWAINSRVSKHRLRLNPISIPEVWSANTSLSSILHESTRNELLIHHNIALFENKDHRSSQRLTMCITFTWYHSQDCVTSEGEEYLSYTTFVFAGARWCNATTQHFKYLPVSCIPTWQFHAPIDSGRILDTDWKMQGL